LIDEVRLSIVKAQIAPHKKHCLHCEV